MAFSVTPSSADVGVLDPGEVQLVAVAFGDVPADVVGSGQVTFALGGETAVVDVTVTLDNANVVVDSITVDPALTDVTITVENLTNAGATIRVARA